MRENLLICMLFTWIAMNHWEIALAAGISWWAYIMLIKVFTWYHALSNWCLNNGKCVMLICNIPLWKLLSFTLYIANGVETVERNTLIITYFPTVCQCIKQVVGTGYTILCYVVKFPDFKCCDYHITSIMHALYRGRFSVNRVIHAMLCWGESHHQLCVTRQWGDTYIHSYMNDEQWCMIKWWLHALLHVYSIWIHTVYHDSIIQH